MPVGGMGKWGNRILNNTCFKLLLIPTENWYGSLIIPVKQIFKPEKLFVMLRWTVIFLVVAIIAAIFGFGGVAAGAASIAKILFFIFLVLFVLSLIAGGTRRRTL